MLLPKMPVRDNPSEAREWLYDIEWELQQPEPNLMQIRVWINRIISELYGKGVK